MGRELKRRGKHTVKAVHDRIAFADAGNLGWVVVKPRSDGWDVVIYEDLGSGLWTGSRISNVPFVDEQGLAI